MGLFKTTQKVDKNRKFIDELRPGDFVEMQDKGSLQESEDIDSKEVVAYEKGAKFMVRKFGSSERRALVVSSEVKDKKEGWISVETRKGQILVGPVSSPDEKVNSTVPTGADKFQFCKTCKVGDYGQTLFAVTVRRDEEITSPVTFELGVGVPFQVKKRGHGRRIQIMLLTKNNHLGWISCETRKCEPLIVEISQKNRTNLVDAIELAKEYEVGQTHEVKVSLRADETEFEASGSDYRYLQPGEVVQIMEMSSKTALRVKVRTKDADASGKQRTGWVSLVGPTGEFNLGKVGSASDANAATGWNKSKVKTLLFAARDGNLATLKSCLDGGGMFSSAISVNAADSQGKTALIYSSAFGRQDLVSNLLSRQNIEVNGIDTFNRTPLHHAARIGHYKIITMLVKAGANVNARDFKGYVPLMQLATIGSKYPDAYVSAKFLLQHNALPNVLDYNGLGAVDFAHGVRDQKMVQTLVDGGAPKPKIEAPMSPSSAPAADKDEEKAADNWDADSVDEEGEGMKDQIQADMDPKDVAQSNLDRAVEGTDLNKLNQAISQAEEFQLDVQFGVQRAGELKKAISATEWFRKCWDENPQDVPKIKAALEAAKGSFVTGEKLDKWKKQLKEIVPAYEARLKLDEASKPENLKDLEAAIKAASGILDAAQLAPYQKKHDEYKNIDSAIHSLKQAKKDLDIESLINLTKQLQPHASKLSEKDKALMVECEAIVKVELPKLQARKDLKKVMEADPSSEGYIDNIQKVCKEVEKIIPGDPQLIKGQKLVKAEMDKRRLKEELTKLMELSKTFNKIQDVDELIRIKEGLERVCKEGRHPDIGMSEIDLAPVQLRIRRLHNHIEDLKGAIRIYFRSRPLSLNEKDQGAKEVFSFTGDGMTINVSDLEGNSSKFALDGIFNPGTQLDVFEDCKSLCQSVIDGYNCTLFAYGQTGAGKTYTMYGQPEGPNVGLVPRILEEIFVVTEEQTKSTFTVLGSMIELYRSDFSDLISDVPVKQRPPLNIRMDKSGSVYVENMTERQCHTPKDLSGMILDGFNNRKVAATLMNAESSRSHLIVIVKVISVNKETGEKITGKFLLVDLAGSERIKKSGVEGDNLKEAIEINKSLTALGNVIEQLTGGSKTIGYRDHKLTQVMQDSLGGTAKTLMFCNCSPSSTNVDETLMTLKWATRAKQVTNDKGKPKQASAKSTSTKKKPAPKR